MGLFKKRMLASILVFVLVFSSTPLFGGLPAFADEEDLAPGVTQMADEDVSATSEEDEAEGEEELSALEDNPALPLDDFDFLEIQLQVLTSLEEDDQNYAEGEVIVVFLEDLTLDEVGEILRDVDAVEEDSLTAESMIADDTVVVELADDVSVFEAIAELSRNPEIAFAQPNYCYELLESEEAGIDLDPLATVIDDPYRGLQWSLNQTGLYDAWSLSRANHTVSVAVIDTGVNTEHEDLKNNIYPNSYYDATKSGLTGDSNGHGTHVAGIIAAQTNNGLGVSGVSYNASIIPIRTQDADGKIFTSYACTAYDYLIKTDGSGRTPLAEAANLRVINMSLGQADAYDPLLEQRINRAYNVGVLTVAAAGNTNNGLPFYPGSCANCINVSALKQGPTPLNDVYDPAQSNYGSTVSLSAPGTSIYSTYGTGYGGMSGTSMAAPFVSGVAALVFAANPSLTPSQVRATLENTAVDLGDPGWDPYYGYGEVNPYAAVLAVGVTGIDNDQPKGTGIPINCRIKTTLPVVDTWDWSVVSGPGTISASGVLTPSAVGTITVKATYTEDSAVFATKEITVVDLELSYSTHVQYDGWQLPVSAGKVSGTSGRSLRLEGLKINLKNYMGIPGEIEYTTHVQNVGWLPPVVLTTSGFSDEEVKGGLSGTEGKSLRLEALKINLTGDLAEYYDIYYRVHAENVGWMGWAKNGDVAGT
ncbi:MAG: S8 family serine peptidase, partial [Coriobacteriia bacterium]|nr:S8 family serine peptidase [Coriobacteriia bacterium]